MENKKKIEWEIARCELCDQFFRRRLDLAFIDKGYNRCNKCCRRTLYQANRKRKKAVIKPKLIIPYPY